MSADNGIYIGCFKDKEFRVIHAQAIDNVYYPNGENALSIVEYFGDAPIFNSIEEAQKEASRQETECLNDKFCPILEYGINILKFSKSFEAYVNMLRPNRR